MKRLATIAAGYGGDSAESGPVYDEQSAVMEAVGYGAGTVSFYWKVSSEEDCDYLEFYIDDELQDWGSRLGPACSGAA